MGGSSPFGDTTSLRKICHPRALSGYVRGTTYGHDVPPERIRQSA